MFCVKNPGKPGLSLLWWSEPGPAIHVAGPILCDRPDGITELQPGAILPIRSMNGLVSVYRVQQFAQRIGPFFNFAKV